MALRRFWITLNVLNALVCAFQMTRTSGFLWLWDFVLCVVSVLMAVGFWRRGRVS
jgi:hypothetical protein